MDVDGDNEAGIEVGRRHASPSTSRGSSPVAKRQRPSFSPASDDDDLVVPAVHSEGAETPTHENAPVIRQAVGFSSVNANVCTYQATVAPPPVVPYFLPGQAPPPPPKPKVSKPRAPRKKKDQQYSDKTSKFKLSSSTPVATLPANSADAILSSRPAYTADPHSMIPSTSYPFGYANGNATAGPSVINGTTGMTLDVSPVGAKRPRNSKRKAPAPTNESLNQPSTRPPPPPPNPVRAPVTSQCPLNIRPEGSRVERPEPAPVLQNTQPGPTNTSSAAIQSSARNSSRPLRMVTLLIEDMRSGVPDSQLAEVKVPLKVADDPEDGFWADAAEICNALQSGPSRIDGAAKVYTMRGRFRQFFMRIDQFDQLQVQSAHIGVSKERTLTVYVEAPVPQGHPPRPPAQLADAQLPAQLMDARPSHSVSAEREPMASYAEPRSRPTYSLPTREDTIERLSKSSYAKPQRSYSPVSDSGSYGHSQRTASPHRSSRQDPYASSSQRLLTPPVPGQLADTQEEVDEAIANYIRSHIENHSGWMEYMQSKAKPQRVSEVLKQYVFVEDRIRELVGRRTPAHWDGAPNCIVNKHHIWRVLKLDSKWGQECQDTSLLVGFYGENGSRYEDSRVVDMINDTSPPRTNTMERFLRLLRSVDESFTQDVLSGQFEPDD